MILTPASGPAGAPVAGAGGLALVTARSMACGQGVGEGLEGLRARLAALVEILYPVLGDRLERCVEHLLVVGPEFDDLHALRLDLVGCSQLAVLEALAALARRLFAGFDQRLADVLGQAFEFALTHRVSEDRSAEILAFGTGFQQLAELVGYRALIGKDHAVERAARQ